MTKAECIILFEKSHSFSCLSEIDCGIKRIINIDNRIFKPDRKRERLNIYSVVKYLCGAISFLSCM